ncbi:ROK family transcriptional regulator [Nonomuraea wenchangensis]|uniref:Sugar kinase of the NBD/HSP70 family, may contain an N-terminal HTH domain n=1 Tax=Nonomuraea wenchangensis TaxID=568860 RepID=A0A1I0LF98_9ACTN|nr:ROK family transcriptional regulator [Nonomuraea wenchangensis]SEU38824.1 Sugar kinase of the NBD/HSP70 family, may contain an N-terminal HTH domain [Nonomuraea wenchangensis]
MLTAGQILQLIRNGTCRTRKELIEHTGLSRSTITDRVDRLIDAGYIHESGVGASGGGRPPSVLDVDAGRRLMLVADLGAIHARVALTDLAARPLAEESAGLRIDLGPEAVLSWVRECFQRLLDRAGRLPGEVCGIGIDLPGSVDHVSGRVIRSFLMPGWDDFPVGEAVGAGYDVPILVENDANAMALGEWWTSWRGSDALLLVKVSTGIGTGIVLDGQIYRGVEEAAGNIGHVRIRESDDRVCTCGSRGCVASLASGRALAADLGQESSLDVVRLVQTGDPAAIARTQEAGRTLGVVLATAVSLLNPAALVLAGDMAETREHYLTGIREVVYRRSLPYTTRNLEIVTSSLGGRAGIAGMAVIVMEHVLSAAAVDAALRPKPAG